MTETETDYLDVPCAKCGLTVHLPLSEVVDAGGLGLVQHTVCPGDAAAKPKNTYSMTVSIIRTTPDGTEAELCRTGARDVEAYDIGTALEELGTKLSDNWARMTELAGIAEGVEIKADRSRLEAQILDQYGQAPSKPGLLAPTARPVPKLIVPGQ